MRRERFLREMGIVPVWRLREYEPAPEVEPEPEPEPEPQRTALEFSEAVPEQKAGSNTQSRHLRQERERKGGNTETPRAERAEAPVTSSYLPSGPVDKFDWPELEDAIAGCRACRLCETRRNVVPGSGDRQARVLFVGEGPGAEEDRRGLPFVGAAGQLLDAMLAAVGLNREDGVYIANTVKCRPPLNRTPGEDEIAACAPFLDRQIELLQPDLIVALGRPAAQRLLGQSVRINVARGRQWSYRERIPVIVTYHPAYLLRNPGDKAKAWSDLCMIRHMIDS